MKIMLYIQSILFILSLTVRMNAQETPTEVKAMPVGGLERYMEWLDSTIVYSDAANAAGIKGTLTALFVVETDGSLSSIQVTDSLGYGIETDLIHAISRSKRWHTALNNGLPVRTSYSLTVPINTRNADHVNLTDRANEYMPPVHNGGIDPSPDLPAEPPGGLNAFNRWVAQNYRYPPEAVDHGVSGQLIVTFVVEADGSLSDITVLKHLGYGTGEEAVRVLKKSPPWMPAMSGGQKIRTRFQLPVRLSLD